MGARGTRPSQGYQGARPGRFISSACLFATRPAGRGAWHDRLDYVGALCIGPLGTPQRILGPGTCNTLRFDKRDASSKSPHQTGQGLFCYTDYAKSKRSDAKPEPFGTLFERACDTRRCGFKQALTKSGARIRKDCAPGLLRPAQAAHHAFTKKAASQTAPQGQATGAGMFAPDPAVFKTLAVKDQANTFQHARSA